MGLFIMYYVLISISELFVSAIGLSMIGIYCDSKTIGFAMSAWYISSSMANSITGLLNQVVALPKDVISTVDSASLYQSYFFDTSVSVMFVGVFVLILAYFLIRFMRRKNIEFV